MRGSLLIHRDRLGTPAFPHYSSASPAGGAASAKQFSALFYRRDRTGSNLSRDQKRTHQDAKRSGVTIESIARWDQSLTLQH
jgi:hypothetical protein